LPKIVVGRHPKSHGKYAFFWIGLFLGLFGAPRVLSLQLCAEGETACALKLNFFIDYDMKSN